MKYFVIATHWDNAKNDQVKFIAGEFNNYMNASLFRDAYNEHYKASAYIISEDEIIK